MGGSSASGSSFSPMRSTLCAEAGTAASSVTAATAVKMRRQVIAKTPSLVMCVGDAAAGVHRDRALAGALHDERIYLDICQARAESGGEPGHADHGVGDGLDIEDG